MATMPQFVPVGSRARSRLPAAGSGLFLWPVSARPFRGTTAAEISKCPARFWPMASRSGTRTATPRYLHAHGGIPPPRPGDLRCLGRLGRSTSARSVALRSEFLLCHVEFPPGPLRSSSPRHRILSCTWFRPKTVRQPNAEPRGSNRNRGTSVTKCRGFRD